MFNTIKKLFGKGARKREFIHTTEIEKVKKDSSDLYVYKQIDKSVDKNEPAKIHKISLVTIPVEENVPFEDASSRSLSFKIDRNNIRYTEHFRLRDKEQFKNIGYFFWNLEDGSAIYEVLESPMSQIQIQEYSPEREAERSQLKKYIDLIRADTRRSVDSRISFETPSEPPARSTSSSDSVEPALVIVFGPPVNANAKDMFESYQLYKEHSGAQGSKLWEDFEYQTFGKLLECQDNCPSTMDKLLTDLFKIQIKVESYSKGCGHHRGSWVNVLLIPISGIWSTSPDFRWPPTQEHASALAAMLGYILSREWMETYSVIPKAH